MSKTAKTDYAACATDVATKADLAAAAASLREEMQALRGELRAEIQRAKTDVITWIAGMLLVHGIVLAAVLAVLLRPLA